jgi:hypothetical protein
LTPPRTATITKVIFLPRFFEFPVSFGAVFQPGGSGLKKIAGRLFTMTDRSELKESIEGELLVEVRRAYAEFLDNRPSVVSTPAPVI